VSYSFEDQRGGDRQTSVRPTLAYFAAAATLLAHLLVIDLALPGAVAPANEGYDLGLHLRGHGSDHSIEGILVGGTVPPPRQIASSISLALFGLIGSGRTDATRSLFGSPARSLVGRDQNRSPR